MHLLCRNLPAVTVNLTCRQKQYPKICCCLFKWHTKYISMATEASPNFVGK